MDFFIGLVALFFVLVLLLLFNFYFNNLKFFFILIIKKNFFLSFFFLPFLLSRVADRVLVLRPIVRAESLRWESRVQDTGLSGTSWPHVI